MKLLFIVYLFTPWVHTLLHFINISPPSGVKVVVEVKLVMLVNTAEPSAADQHSGLKKRDPLSRSLNELKHREFSLCSISG